MWLNTDLIAPPPAPPSCQPPPPPAPAPRPRPESVFGLKEAPGRVGGDGALADGGGGEGFGLKAGADAVVRRLAQDPSK